MPPCLPLIFWETTGSYPRFFLQPRVNDADNLSQERSICQEILIQHK